MRVGQLHRPRAPGHLAHRHRARRDHGRHRPHLYGAKATIHATGFEDHRVDDGTYDLVIGNVPFAKVTPHDPRHNRGRHALHNYFLIKSLHLLRPGGLVVALTSRYTLDARNPASRREMAAVADLIGALRLPERAFAAPSGTDVVVDLLILRRRLPGQEPSGPPWARTVPANIDPGEQTNDPAEPLDVNEYFDAHPDHILGQLTAGRGHVPRPRAHRLANRIGR